jgi:hypothetical protein
VRWCRKRRNDRQGATYPRVGMILLGRGQAKLARLRLASHRLRKKRRMTGLASDSPERRDVSDSVPTTMPRPPGRSLEPRSRRRELSPMPSVSLRGRRATARPGGETAGAARRRQPRWSPKHGPFSRPAPSAPGTRAAHGGNQGTARAHSEVRQVVVCLRQVPRPRLTSSVVLDTTP